MHLNISDHEHHRHEHDNSNSSDAVIVAKTVSMTVLFSASLVIGLLPICLFKYYKWKTSLNNNPYLRSLLCFGGGVLFCTTFVHLLPEVKESVDELMANNHLPHSHIPYAECLMCFGVLLMYFVEEAVHYCIHLRKENDASQIEMENVPQQGDIVPHNTHHHEVEVGDFRGLLIVLALSTHELFEGLAVGLEKSSGHVWYLLVAISAHKLVIAFCLGLKLVLTKITIKSVFGCIFLFAFVSPMGIGIGLLITNTTLLDVTVFPQVVLQGIATGTLLYVIIFEIFQKNADGGLKTYFSFLVGFLVMLLLQLLTEMDEILVTKIIAMTVLAAASFTIGLLPWKLYKHVQLKHSNKGDEKNLTLSLLLCFGGGVLLYTTFLHLQPEVRECFRTLHFDFLKDLHTSVSDLIFCIGFFFVYLIEEIAHICIINDDRGDDDNEDVILRRSLSIRGPRSHPSESQKRQLTRANDNGDNAIGVKHHHCHDNAETFTKSIRRSVTSLLVVIALCFHAIFEGLAVGLEDSVQKVWYLFTAIATHKLVIAFCIGVELVSSKTRFSLIVLYLSTFALVSPLDRRIGVKEILNPGIGLGIILSNSGGGSSENLTAVILQGMAAGTLLYVVFFEVLAREKNNKHCGIWQLIAIIFGFSTMFCLQMFTQHDHSHGDGHGHSHEYTHEPSVRPDLKLVTEAIFNMTTIR